MHTYLDKSRRPQGGMKFSDFPIWLLLKTISKWVFLYTLMNDQGQIWVIINGNFRYTRGTVLHKTT